VRGGTGTVSRAAAARILACALVLLVVLGAAAASAHAAARARINRVLIISLPDTEWSDIQRVRPPHLMNLFAHSAVGGLITNGVNRPAAIGDVYVTLGAGTRAVSDPKTGGQGFGVDEPFGRDRAGTVFTTRTGTPAARGLVLIPIADVTEANDAELFDAHVGELGAELAHAGVHRAVIANGDGSDPSTPSRTYPPYRREAVSALMGPDGKVPRGRVDTGLLLADPTATFGVRLDPAAVLGAFDAAFTDRSVVLVEGSDLVRADLAGQFASDSARQQMRDRALRATDRLVGQLLTRIDPARDAVIVVGPEPPAFGDSLTPVAVQAPGFRSGLLESPTTHRAGFVNVVDVAPTVLGLYGIARPDNMEGRPMSAVPSDAAVGSRVGSLVNANQDGLFRDRQVGTSMAVVVGFGSALLVATAAFVDRWPRVRPLLRFGALWLLGYLLATSFAGPIRFARHGGAGPYWVFVVGGGVLLACLFLAIGSIGSRRRPVDALLVALGATAGLHLVDLVTGAHLELDTVFGYTPTVGIRFVGEGNLTFAVLSAAVVLFAGLVAWRLPGRAGTGVAIALMAVTVVVIGAPWWGNDFGGVIATAPAFALLAWLLLGHRVRWRTVLLLFGVLAVTGVAVGFLDLLRPADQRTHVGRFFHQLLNDPSGALLVVRRKASENWSVLGHSVLLGMVIVVVLLIAYLWLVPPRSLRALVAEIPTARATMLAFVVVAALGFALNDSGITITGMMAAVLESTIVFLVARRT
jgi:hypothetical protein